MTAEQIIEQIRDLDPKEIEKLAQFFREAERRKRQTKYIRNDARFRKIVDRVFEENAWLFRKLAEWERENEPVKKVKTARR